MITWDAYMFLEDLEAELNDPFRGCNCSEDVVMERHDYIYDAKKEQAMEDWAYLQSRIQELQRKWDAFPLPHHAYSRFRDWIAYFPTDDDLPF